MELSKKDKIKKFIAEIENILNNKYIVMIILSLTILVGVLIVVWFEQSKQYYFYDELRTIEDGATAYYGGINWTKCYNFIGQTVDGGQFRENLTTRMPETRELPKYIVKQVSRILIFGRYSDILNLVAVITNSSFSLNLSYGINCFLYVCMSLLIYAICKKIYRKNEYAILAVALCNVSPGIIMTSGYIRHYQLFIVQALMLVLLYLIVIENEISSKKLFGVTIGILYFTWVGYNNAEYMIIFSVLMFCGGIIINCIKNNWINLKILVGAHVVAAVCFLIYKGPLLWFLITNPDSEIYIEINRLLFDSWVVSKEPLKRYFYSLYTDSLFGLRIYFICLLAIVIAFCIGKIKENVNSNLISRWVLLLFVTVVYTSIVARISPWFAIRYISVCYPLVIIIVVGFITVGKYNGNIKLVLALFMLYYALHGIVVYQEPIRDQYNQSGPTAEQLSYMQSTFNDTDSVFLTDGNEGTFYYGAFLWPSSTKILIADKESINNMKKDDGMLAADSILIWVYNNEEELWANAILPKMNELGFYEFQMKYDTGVKGRYKIYLCTR